MTTTTMTTPDLPFELIIPEDGLPHCVTTTWDGTRIAWDTCAGCHQHIVNCTHDVPIESAWLQRQRSKDTYLLFTMAHPGDGRGGSSYVATNDRSERFERAPRRIPPSPADSSLNVMDLVDQDLVNKIKTASEDRDVSGD